MPGGDDETDSEGEGEQPEQYSESECDGLEGDLADAQADAEAAGTAFTNAQDALKRDLNATAKDACGYDFDDQDRAADDAVAATIQANTSYGYVSDAFDGDKDTLRDAFSDYNDAWENFEDVSGQIIDLWVQRAALVDQVMDEEGTMADPADPDAAGVYGQITAIDEQLDDLAGEELEAAGLVNDLEQDLIDEVGSEHAVNWVADWIEDDTAASEATDHSRDIYEALHSIPGVPGEPHITQQWSQAKAGTHKDLEDEARDKADAEQDVRDLEKTIDAHCQEPEPDDEGDDDYDEGDDYDEEDFE